MRIFFRLIFCFLLLSILNLELSAQFYTIQDLGTLGNAIYAGTWPLGINNKGQVVGYYFVFDPVNGEETRAFIWENGVMTDLGLGNSSTAVDINDNSTITGDMLPLGGYIYKNGSATPLGTLGGNHSVAAGINSLDQIVGKSPPVSGPGLRSHAFLYSGGTMIDLGTFGGFDNSIFSGAAAINESGTIVGRSSTPPKFGLTYSYGFIYENGIMTRLVSLLADENSGATDINNQGQIVGTAVGGFATRRAVIWENGTIISLHNGVGHVNSKALRINNSGDVVGLALNGAFDITSAFIWPNETRFPVNLNFVVPGLAEDVWLTIAYDINDRGQIICTGEIDDITYAFILTPLGLNLLNPQAGKLWIAGTENTIKWDYGEVGDLVQLEFSADSGNTFEVIDNFIPAETGQYAFSIPNSILSTKCYIRIFDMADSTNADTSDMFKIKNYRLTKLDANGDYILYDIIDDRWGFGNNRSDVWPSSWWQRFDYQGTDPFTGSQYSQWQGNKIFKKTHPFIYPDWEAWVNTYTVNVCYISTFFRIYSQTALTRWNAANIFWKGSCFGIAASNALAFSHRVDFVSEFPFFPSFTDPILVTSDTNVIPVITELYSHQFGNPTRQLTKDRWRTITPNQTLNEVKEMLLQDDVAIRTLSIGNNNGTGAHTIIPFKLEQDHTQDGWYLLFVYDNTRPNDTTAFVLIDTTGNLNNGTWSTQYAWVNWGGSRKLMLMNESSVYLNDPILPKNSGAFVSPFILSGDDLEVYNNIDVNTRIYDSQGNLTGFVNGTVFDEIANSVPLIYMDGNETPPYGYYLPTDNYSIQVSDFTSDTVETFFFTGNKSYLYERTGTINSETDRLFFDGGVSVVNPDQVDKSISLVNIINGSTQEKLFALTQINLAQNDSVKIENPDDNNLKFISYGTEKNYQIELNYATQLGLGRFANNSISITQNTTHLLVPNWGDFADLQLTIYVDEGNDGTIDDTLYIINDVTGVEDDQGSLIPTEYRLEQNYPNPFNLSTRIKYAVPKESLINIMIFNALGQEMAELVNENKPAGNYEVEFNAEDLASGVYIYRMKAGDFIETKKMVLMK